MTTPREKFREWLFSNSMLGQESCDRIADMSAHFFTPAEPVGASDLVNCPDCNSGGKSNWIPVAVKTSPDGRKLTDDEAREFATHISKCHFCDGIGKVKAERLEWRAIGDQWRAMRLQVRMGLRQWAEHIRVLPSDYCDMEQGRVRPDERFSPAQLLPENVARQAPPPQPAAVGESAYDPPPPDMDLSEQVRHARGFASGVCRNDHHTARLLEQMARSIEGLTTALREAEERAERLGRAAREVAADIRAHFSEVELVTSDSLIGGWREKLLQPATPGEGEGA